MSQKDHCHRYLNKRNEFKGGEGVELNDLSADYDERNEKKEIINFSNNNQAN